MDSPNIDSPQRISKENDDWNMDKINSVALDETSDKEIVKLTDLARRYPITLRFIEKMPFSGISISNSVELLNGLG